ncbi:hypothetical protein GCM10007377_16070 [Galliscardovia ingluviei]|uniref:Toxin HicA n=1 Tax=Galliscardovia ingluviei TaxID=1769422 RepID=A0A8J3EZN2_9BIFI|nr:type II toxin-antitoxin system HicA family toxin [Galliscardovia ingluviei]GGI15472.1 hypothetical protein GCM10007377_16070 [Galliscardovia ingluviei]
MTKQKAIIKALRKAAKARNMPFEQAPRKGGNHDIWLLDGKMIVIPRHKEIPELTTASIYKQAAEKLGKDWWK